MTSFDILIDYIESTKYRPAFKKITWKDNACAKRLILTPLKTAFLSIGTNIGNRSLNLQNCIEMISQRIGEPRRISNYYLSESWGFDADQFLNAVVEIEVAVKARELLKLTQGIESQMGRNKLEYSAGYESRVIDIDILTFGDEIIYERGLKIPHPRLAYRNFVLMPWVELAPDLILPDTGRSVLEIFRMCEDRTKCEKVKDV